MANSGKSSRRSRRRRRRRSRPKDEKTKHNNRQTTSKRSVRVDKAAGELPKAFIYTYTIYKALE